MEPTIRGLFPLAQNALDPLNTEELIDVTEQEVEAVLKQLPQALTPGPSGLRTDHIITLCNTPHRAELITRLTRFVQLACSGELPIDMGRWICGGTLIPTKKKDEGIRPLVASETLRSIVSRVTLGSSRAQLEQPLSPCQYGNNAKARGLQTAILLARRFAQDVQDKIMFKLDLRNAFNCINRKSCDNAAISGQGRIFDCTSGVQHCLH
jgi:hypothetical protein